MSHLRTLSIAIVLAAAATSASAQLNPMGRGDRHSFSFGQGFSAPQSATAGTLGGNNIGRPLARFGPVTPVPEPSSWAMMVAGLALVGAMVRRHTKR